MCPWFVHWLCWPQILPHLNGTLWLPHDGPFLINKFNSPDFGSNFIGTSTQFINFFTDLLSSLPCIYLAFMWALHLTLTSSFLADDLALNATAYLVKSQPSSSFCSCSEKEVYLHSFMVNSLLLSSPHAFPIFHFFVHLAPTTSTYLFCMFNLSFSLSTRSLFSDYSMPNFHLFSKTTQQKIPSSDAIVTDPLSYLMHGFIFHILFSPLTLILLIFKS